MTEEISAPLATLAIIAYNQEGVIREAIEGAFTQTYSPLEIILSDDCSPDGTFEVMQQMAAAYGGPHRVIARQTPQNLRLVPHLDDVMAVASGAFFVAHAGDDISLPDRVARLMATWLDGAGRVMMVHSAAEEMTVDGQPTGVVLHAPEKVWDQPTGATFIRDQGCVMGSTAGWDRRVFDHFGPLGPELSSEDRVMPFRATLLGEVVYLKDPLVKYRMGGISGMDARSDTEEFLYGLFHRLRKWISEIDRHILARFGEMEYPEKVEIEATCRRRGPLMELRVTLAEAGYLKRLMLGPCALVLGLRNRSFEPMKHWLQYLLDKPYIAFARYRAASRVGQLKE